MLSLTVLPLPLLSLTVMPLTVKTPLTVLPLAVLSGLTVYESGKACDNCDEHISAKSYWTCGECSIDFCTNCYTDTQKAFEHTDLEHADWVVRFVTALARHVLLSVPCAGRHSLVGTLANQWPSAMFERLVMAVVDVADASVVHIEDNVAAKIAVSIQGTH